MTEGAQRPGVSPVRVFFGRILFGAGLLIGGLSGLCTGGFFVITLITALQSPPRKVLELYDNLSLPFAFGGVPWGLGGAAVLLSGPVLRAAPRRRLAQAALAISALILAATVPDLVYVLVHGPDKWRGLIDLGARVGGNWTSALEAACGGAVLLAAALYELRRRWPQD